MNLKNNLNLSRVQERPETFCGYKVYVHPDLDDIPKMQLSPKLHTILTPQFVEETNAWMKDFFGVEHKVMMCQNPYIPGSFAIFMGPSTYLRYREQSHLPELTNGTI